MVAQRMISSKFFKTDNREMNSTLLSYRSQSRAMDTLCVFMDHLLNDKVTLSKFSQHGKAEPKSVKTYPPNQIKPLGIQKKTV